MAKKESPKKKKLPPGVRERDGRYTYRYSVEVIKDGKRTRKQKETVSYGTAKEAYDAGIQIEADKLRGKLVDEKNITLEQWGERWLRDYEVEREPSHNTLRCRRSALNSICDQIGKHTRLREINGDDYQQWLNTLKKDNRKKNTINAHHSAMRIMFTDATRKKVIAENPTVEAKMPVFKQSLEQIGSSDLPKFLEKGQLKHFLRVVQFRGRSQEYNLFTLLAYTGVRIGELLALKWSDYDKENKWLSITKTLADKKKKGAYIIGPPKNKSSIRKVTIGETAIKALERQRAWQEKYKDDYSLDNDEGFIFWSGKYPGRPADNDWIGIRFRELLQITGLPDTLTPHSLRHTHVSLLAEAKEELAVIQERMGHKNDNITRLVYLHVTEGQRQLTPDRFEKVMRG